MLDLTQTSASAAEAERLAAEAYREAAAAADSIAHDADLRVEPLRRDDRGGGAE